MPRFLLAAAVFSTLAVAASAQDAKPADSAPLELTAQHDHKRMEVVPMAGRRTFVLGLMLAGLGRIGAADEPKPAPAQSKTLLERLNALDAEDASRYQIYRDPARQQRLVLRPEPVYRWTNPTRAGGQVGDVFVWLYRGRPEVVASIFSRPARNGKRMVCHELASLSLALLVVDRAAPKQWVPEAAGVELKPVAGAPAPAASAPLRLVQLRTLAREFSGRSLSARKQSWELRLLPQPLFRYESTDPEVIDGALFALVSSAGTDPEILLLLEARPSPDGPHWLFAAARFSDMDLWLEHKKQEVWSSIRSNENQFEHDAKHRYRFYEDRTIPEINVTDEGQ